MYRYLEWAITDTEPQEEQSTSKYNVSYLSASLRVVANT